MRVGHVGPMFIPIPRLSRNNQNYDKHPSKKIFEESLQGGNIQAGLIAETAIKVGLVLTLDVSNDLSIELE